MRIIKTVVGFCVVTSCVGCWHEGIKLARSKIERKKNGFQFEKEKPVFVTGTTGGGRGYTRPVPADPATFKAIPGHTKGTKFAIRYARDATRVFAGFPGRFALLAGRVVQLDNASPDSFEFVTPDGEFVKDDKNVYFHGIRLIDADPRSFIVFESADAPDRQASTLVSPYARDAHQIYAGPFRIKVAHPENFEVIRTGQAVTSWAPEGDPTRIKISTITGWARDGQHYYYGTQQVPGLDYASFAWVDGRSVRGSFARDHSKIFLYDRGDISLIHAHYPKPFKPDEWREGGRNWKSCGTDIRY